MSLYNNDDLPPLPVPKPTQRAGLKTVMNLRMTRLLIRAGYIPPEAMLIREGEVRWLEIIRALKRCTTRAERDALLKELVGGVVNLRDKTESGK